MTSKTVAPKTPLAVPDALRNFADLPDDANVRVRTVAGLFGCSVPSVWRMAKDGRIPAPRKISVGISAWRVGTLRAILNTR